MRTIPLSKLLLPFAAALALQSIAGCAISPGAEVKQEEMCFAKGEILDVGEPEETGAHSSTSPTNFRAVVRGVREANERRDPVHAPAGDVDKISPSILVISGGSQNGAFGAGFLASYGETLPEHRLPRYKVVTGISTGAILSSFAFIDDMETMVTNYTLNAESDVLKAYVGDGGKLGLWSGITVARKGALGDLTPLWNRLWNLFDDARLRKIAQAGDHGRRKLFVGAVDVDLGTERVFDMTNLAERYRIAADKGKTDPLEAKKANRYRDCYTSIIVASSSVPMAALPIFIDNRMYIDGGARFGVFVEDLKAASQAPRDVPAAPRSPSDPYIYIVVNGSLKLIDTCGKVDNCPPPPQPGKLAGAHTDWRVLDLVHRAVDVLENQVYRFSVNHISELADDQRYGIAFAKIDPEKMPNHEFPKGSKMTCQKWYDEDVRLDNPLEFHKRFMKCLIDYGRSKSAEWLKFNVPKEN